MNAEQIFRSEDVLPHRSQSGHAMVHYRWPPSGLAQNTALTPAVLGCLQLHPVRGRGYQRVRRCSLCHGGEEATADEMGLATICRRATIEAERQGASRQASLWEGNWKDDGASTAEDG